MNLNDIGTAVLAVIAILGAIGAIIAWFYKRGGTEKGMMLALTENTKATGELTNAFHSFREGTLDKLHSLDVRVTRVEAKQDDSRPANRNASPAG